MAETLIDVFLIRDGREPESCKAEVLSASDEYSVLGILAEEPKQNFDYHKGDKIVIYASETNEGRAAFYTDLNPSRIVTEEELADGSVLKAAVEAFYENRSEEHFIEILEILRDSQVWVPCQMVLSQADQKRLEELAEEATKLNQETVEAAFVPDDDLQMNPCLMEKNGISYFPIFASLEDMAGYGTEYSNLQVHMLKAIEMAKENQIQIEHMVLNPFGKSFMLNTDLWKVIAEMKTRIDPIAVDTTE